jgi:hypothetical protein
MIPAFLQSGLIGYGTLQVVVAVIAVVLALKWKKFEFLPGLCVLLLYTIIEVIDVFFFTILQNEYIDIAQFGFILLAIVFFIIGMHPSGGLTAISIRKRKDLPSGSSRKESVFSLLRKT